MCPSVHSFLSHVFESYPDYNAHHFLPTLRFGTHLPYCIYLVINYKLTVSNIIAYPLTVTLFKLHSNTSLQLTFKLTYIFASKSKRHVGIRAAEILLSRKDQIIIISTMVFVLNVTVWITEIKTLEI